MSRGSRVRLFSPVLWAFLCALMLRVALPAGTMVSAEGANGPVITLCSGSGVFQAVLEDGKLKPVGHKPGAAREHGACPFAGGHAWVPPAEPEAATAQAFAWSQTPSLIPPARLQAIGLRAPPPPSRAPPILMS